VRSCQATTTMFHGTLPERTASPLDSHEAPPNPQIATAGVQTIAPSEPGLGSFFEGTSAKHHAVPPANEIIAPVARVTAANLSATVTESQTTAFNRNRVSTNLSGHRDGFQLGLIQLLRHRDRNRSLFINHYGLKGSLHGGAILRCAQDDERCAQDDETLRSG
jgi:hypothetical protein